jgi:hypothetical protein
MRNFRKIIDAPPQISPEQMAGKVGELGRTFPKIGNKFHLFRKSKYLFMEKLLGKSLKSKVSIQFN